MQDNNYIINIVPLIRHNLAVVLFATILLIQGNTKYKNMIAGRKILQYDVFYQDLLQAAGLIACRC